jgi:hypothetical protein
LAEGKLVLAGLRPEFVAGQARRHAVVCRPDCRNCGSVSARASKYSWFDEGRDFSGGFSIKSLTAERSSIFTAIGIAGIIFSTLGTSLAAINSFYSPRSIYERDERTLSNLRSLHLQLVNGVARSPKLTSP